MQDRVQQIAEDIFDELPVLGLMDLPIIEDILRRQPEFAPNPIAQHWAPAVDEDRILRQLEDSL